MYLCLFTALRQDRIISSQKVRHVQTAVTGVFFAASVFNSIQYFLNAEGQNNAITMWTKPMKRNWCRKQDSQRKRPGEVEHYWKFLVWIQLVFFDAMIGSKNHTICKIHVSDIFPTDWAEDSRSAITPCATTGSEWSEMIKLYCKITIYEQSRR